MRLLLLLLASAEAFLHKQPVPSVLLLRAQGNDDVESNRDIVKEDLLCMIPRMRFGAPATNETVASRTVRRIEKRVEALESYDEELHSGGPLASNPKAQELLDGPWRLLYSDASEITNLVDLPLGFRLGAVFQPIDVQTGRVENQANVKHRFLLASAHTRVLARFGLEEDLKAKNRAGVSNTEGRRVNVQFEKVVFSLRRVLFVPFLSRLVRRVARPRGPAEKALEAAKAAAAIRRNREALMTVQDMELRWQEHRGERGAQQATRRDAPCARRRARWPGRGFGASR